MLNANYPKYTRQVQENFKKIISQDIEGYEKEFRTELWSKLRKSSASYQGEPVPFLYNPFLISLNDWFYLQEMMDKFTNILEKVIDNYLTSKKFRSYFPFDSQLEQYILIDPGYESYYPIARFDLFWQGSGQVKFCEINTDGTSAMNEVRVIQELVNQGKAVKKLKKKLDLSLAGFELFNSWLDKMLAIYREFIGKKKVNPTVAIMDFKGEGVVSEFKEFQNYLSKRGIKSFIADPRELDFKQDKLFYQGEKIDLIYRRATTQRLFAEREQIKDLLEAYRAGAVCLCGSFRSQIIHNKALFEILTDPAKINFLAEEEITFLQDHIPETNHLTADGQTLNELVKRQEELIIKPCDLNACKGVEVGRGKSREEWVNKLEENKDENYLYQKYCSPPQLEMFLTSLSEDGFRFADFNYIIGLFLYDGKLQGIYNRAGRRDIIGAAAECYTTPVYIAGAENILKEELKDTEVILYE